MSLCGVGWALPRVERQRSALYDCRLHTSRAERTTRLPIFTGKPPLRAGAETLGAQGGRGERPTNRAGRPAAPGDEEARGEAATLEATGEARRRKASKVEHEREEREPDGPASHPPHTHSRHRRGHGVGGTKGKVERTDWTGQHGGPHFHDAGAARSQQGFGGRTRCTGSPPEHLDCVQPTP